MSRVAGLLLAAGAGRRMGGPKALLRDPHGVPYLDRAVGRLLDGGCDSVTVVLGASADDARALLDAAGWSDDDAVDVVVAADWDEGMGASLRAGLGALGRPRRRRRTRHAGGPPRRRRAVLRRVLDTGSGALSGALVRATYDGGPGHPVLIGREHWAGVVATAEGDRGARTYFRTHAPVACECGDLATAVTWTAPRTWRQGPTRTAR